MEFQVPQFIETKPKIVGPLTLVQFFYIGAAAGISFLAFSIFNFFIWFIITLLVGALALAFAFLKINGQSFPLILISAIKYFWRPKIYLWRREIPQTTLEIPEDFLEKNRKQLSFQEKLKAAAQRIITAPKHPTAQKTPSRYGLIREKTGEKKIVKKVNY